MNFFPRELGSYPGAYIHMLPHMTFIPHAGKTSYAGNLESTGILNHIPAPYFDPVPGFETPGSAILNPDFLSELIFVFTAP